jgi:hypothetical protein
VFLILKTDPGLEMTHFNGKNVPGADAPGTRFLHTGRNLIPGVEKSFDLW